VAKEVQSLEVSCFVQQTEDEEKIRGAVAALLGTEVAAERQEAEGHFGNKIVWVRLHMTGEEAAASLQHVVSRMAEDERKAIIGSLGEMMDEHNALYIRLNKQVLVKDGEAVLASSDPVRVKVKLRPHLVKGDPEGIYARLLGVAP
jgi:RNA binding exosome subunit